MTYLRAHSRPHERARRIAAGVAIFVGVILAAMQFFMPHLFPGIFASVATPFWRTEFAIESDSLAAPGAVVAENEELRRQLAEAAVRLETIAAVEAENREFKAFFGRSVLDPLGPAAASQPTASTSTSTNPAASTLSIGINTHGPRGMLAAVLARPPFSPYDELIVDIGSDDDIASGDLVYAPGDVLIGRVTDALGATSKVVLFTSPGQRREVLIGENGVSGTAIGRGGGQYAIQLPSAAGASIGDFLISPSISDKPFARVIDVIADPAEAFKTVLAAPPVNVYELRWVFVRSNERS